MLGDVLGGVLTVGCGQEATDVPPTAASIPQTVTGSVRPVPGVLGVPMGPTCVPAPAPAPVQVPLALPSSAAVTAHAVTGAPLLVELLIGAAAVIMGLAISRVGRRRRALEA